MFSLSYFTLSTAVLSLIASTSAGYSATSKNNVAIYYGQGPNEKNLGLHDFCKNSPGVDIIPLGFLDIYPAQGNGFPGTNFASSCTGTTFAGPGYNNVNDPSKNDLQNDCPTLVDGIAYCQSLDKKILLSLGGAPAATPYQLTSTAEAEYLADFLWGAFGPIQHPNTWPRPFDTATKSNTVDGFDFDIELIQPGEQQFYITMINRLISYFPKGAGAKKYLITGAPQCVVPDAQMGDMITAVPFDILFVQYYNTDACSARNWVTANPQYPVVPENPSGFSYDFDLLLDFLDLGASRNAKIFFGLPGAPAAANSNEYLTPSEVAPFLEAYYCQPRFGGVMIWEGIYAYQNNMFQNTIKPLLEADSTNKALATCPTTPPPCCTNPYTIVRGDSCYGIYSSNKLTSEQFYALNPSLGNGANCQYIQPGQTLCLARASSTAAVCSIASATKTTTTTTATPTPTSCVTCTKYYIVQSGNSCYTTWSDNNLSSDQFYALNPSLGPSCLIFPGQALCVAGSVGTCPTSSTTSTTSSTSSTKTSTTTTTTSTSTTKASTTASSTTSSTSSSSSSTKTSTTTSSSSSTTSTSTSPTSSPSSSTKTSTSSTSSSTTVISTSSTLTSSSSSTKTSATSSSSSSTTSVSSTSTKTSTTSSTTSSTSSSSSSTSTSSTTTKASTSSTPSSSGTSSSTTSSTTSSSITSMTSSKNSTSSSSSSTTSSSKMSSTSSAAGTTSSSSSSSSSFSSFSNSTTSSAISTSSPVTYTTTTTSVYTVTSCPPTVTSCPLGHVTTDIITYTTTYCPASVTSTPTSTASSSPVQYTTSVVYTTLTYTITACPSTVTNCPAKMGSVTTETKILYTTVCPVTALATPVVIPASTAPGSPAKEVSLPVMSVSPSTSLSFSAVTYSTVSVPKASSPSSSFAVVYQTMSVIPVASTSPSKSSVAAAGASSVTVASASPVKPGAATFTGEAANIASLGVGGVMAVVLCMVGWVLM